MLDLSKLQKDVYDIKTGEGDEATKIQFNEECTKNRLWTDDLSVATQTITEDTTYNFGFSGSKAIKISGTGSAIFKGDSSEYKPATKISMPSEVVFAGNDALFQISHNYIHGVFGEGKDSSYDGTLSKTVPEGKNINFTNGFEIRKNHTVYVSGKLGG